MRWAGVLLLGSSLAACGGVVDAGSDAGTGGNGTGGTNTGGNGANSGGNSGASSGGIGGGTGTGAGGNVGVGGNTGTPCVPSKCPEHIIGGLISVAGCCASSTDCGSVVDATISALLGQIPPGCYRREQVGSLDCGCPTLTFPNPLQPGKMAQFPGCCRASGRCGYVVDATTLGGPNFGCVEATWGAGVGVSCSPSTSTACDGGVDAPAD